MPVTHTFVSAIADDPASAAAGEVLPSHWNATHTISVNMSELNATGTPDATNFLRGDGSWQTVATSIGIGTTITSATAGSVFFAGASGVLEQDNANLFWDDTNNRLGIGTASPAVPLDLVGTQRITSAANNALVVGANGATNPAFTVNCSIASANTGLEVAAGTNTGSNTTIVTMTTSSSSGSLQIGAKGTGGTFLLVGGAGIVLRPNGTNNRLNVGNTNYIFTAGQITSGAGATFSYVGAANTGLTASAEYNQIYYNLGQTNQHATGAITLQRDFRITPMTHSAVGASTITDAAGFSVDSAPSAGTNVTITNSSAIYSAGGAVAAGVTNSYGLNITANTGATNNYCTRYAGTAGEIFRVRTDGQVAFLATNTAGGTTGAQTINHPSGTVNFAAAATSLVVTNSLVTASSIIFAVVRTNDTTATIKNVVPAAGSFTINLGAAATAETSVGFFVIN